MAEGGKLGVDAAHLRAADGTIDDRVVAAGLGAGGSDLVLGDGVAGDVARGRQDGVGEGNLMLGVGVGKASAADGALPVFDTAGLGAGGRDGLVMLQDVLVAVVHRHGGVVVDAGVGLLIEANDGAALAGGVSGRAVGVGQVVIALAVNLIVQIALGGIEPGQRRGGGIEVLGGIQAHVLADRFVIEGIACSAAGGLPQDLGQVGGGGRAGAVGVDGHGNRRQIVVAGDNRIAHRVAGRAGDAVLGDEDEFPAVCRGIGELIDDRALVDLHAGIDGVIGGAFQRVDRRAGGVEGGLLGGLLHRGLGPADEAPALVFGGRGGQDHVVAAVAGHGLIDRAAGHVSDGDGFLRREVDAHGAVFRSGDGEDVAVPGHGRLAHEDLCAGGIVAGGRRRGDGSAVDGDGAPGVVVGNGGEVEENVVGVGLDAVVAVVRAVGPLAVGLLIVGGVAVVGVDPGAPGDDAAVVEGGIVRGVDVLAVFVGGGAALGDDHGEGIARKQGDRGIQPDGIIAGEGQGAGLGGHLRAGGGVADSGVLVDLHGVVQALVPAAQADGAQGFVALGGEDVGNLGSVGKALVVIRAGGPALAEADHVAGAVVLVVVGVIVDRLGVVEVDIALEDGGVLIGDPAVAAVELTGAPGVLAQPRAVLGRLVRGEQRPGDAVVPADQGDGVVGPLVAAALLAGGVDGAGVGVGVAGLIVADVAGAVVHDGLLDGVDVGGRDPFGVLDVGHIVVVGVLAVQAGAVDRAGPVVGQGCHGFIGHAGPALQGIGGHFAVAALVEAGVLRGGLVAGQHALGVIGTGVVEEAVLRLGEVQAGRGGRAGSDGDAFLDHVALHAGHGCVGPAGAVGVLVLDGGAPALIAVIPLAGKGAVRPGKVHAVDGIGLAAKVGLRHAVGAVMVLMDEAVVGGLGNSGFGGWGLGSGGFVLRADVLSGDDGGEYAEDENEGQKHRQNSLGQVHLGVSFRAFKWVSGSADDLRDCLLSGLYLLFRRTSGGIPVISF